MDLDTKPFEEYLKKLGVGKISVKKEIKGYWNSLWGSYVATAVMTVGLAMIIFPFFLAKDESWSTPVMIVGIIILALGFAGLIAFYVLRFRKIKDGPLPSGKIDLPENLHKTFFEMCVHIPNLEFNGLVENTLLGSSSSGKGLSFTYHGQEFLWNVNETFRLETRMVFNSQKDEMEAESIPIYTLEEAMKINVPSLNDYDELTFSFNYKLGKFLTKRMEKMANLPEVYQTESMAFNDLFQLRGSNQIQIVRLFTPKVLTSMVDDSNNISEFRLDHGVISNETTQQQEEFPFGQEISEIKEPTSIHNPQKRIEAITNMLKDHFKEPLKAINTLEKLEVFED